LDVKDGRVVKGVRFEGFGDISAPVELAEIYNNSGIDELVYYDITASIEERDLFASILKDIKSRITIPLTVGGGINTVDDFGRMLDLGADKISINSGVIKTPELVKEVSNKYGSDRVVFAADVKNTENGYHVFARGGREDTGIDAIDWIKRGAETGAGEIVVNSIDTDGVKNGFDIDLLEAVCNVVSIPVIASGGAGSIDDFINLFIKLPKVTGGLAASVFHFGEVNIQNLKQELHNNGINVRL